MAKVISSKMFIIWLSKTFIKGFKLLKLLYRSCQVKMFNLCSSLQYYLWQGWARSDHNIILSLERWNRPCDRSRTNYNWGLSSFIFNSHHISRYNKIEGGLRSCFFTLHGSTLINIFPKGIPSQILNLVQILLLVSYNLTRYWNQQQQHISLVTNLTNKENTKDKN